MKKIKILPLTEVQKIAAGEVVQRPVNVVKELLENALDAGASKLQLHIEKAGKKRICITDNGSGMEHEDALACFLPHATSKLEKADGIAQVQTFGFRGEALASIAAVSKIELITKADSADDHALGTQVCIEGGLQTACNAHATLPGTRISVHDLFYNTPARRLFLKRDETEWQQILTCVQAFCLSNLQIDLKLYHDHHLVYDAPPAPNTATRMSQLWGHHTADKMLELSSEQKYDDVTVAGIISQPHWWRYNRNQIFFFVNGRWVKNSNLIKGLMQGYAAVLPAQKYPAAVLSFWVDQNSIDINVHPQKDEVQFSQPLRIQKAVAHQTLKTLEAYTTKQLAPRPSSTYYVPKTLEYAVAPLASVPSQDTATPALQLAKETAPGPIEQAPHIAKHTETITQKVLPSSTIKLHLTQSTQQPIHCPAPEEEVSIIGQLFNTYILIEQDKELVLIDQHAAHERILYERFTKQFAIAESTTLLFPRMIWVSAADIEVLLNLQELLMQQGIIFDRCGEERIALTATPPQAQHIDYETLFTTLINLSEDRMIEHEDVRAMIREHVHSHLACKSAIRAGDILSHARMQEMLRELRTCDNRFICAHGRPTSWTVSQAYIEKQFKRRL